MVDPVGLLRLPLDRPLDCADEWAELVVTEAVDEQDAGVRAPGRCPVAKDVGEVVDVERHEDAPLARRESEHFGVLEAFERRLLVECSDVVPTAAELGADARSRDMRVEEEAHPLFGARLEA